MFDIEKEVLINRYLYYVLAQPIISDFEYDIIERQARDLLPEDNIVHKIGSSLPSSYSEEIIKLALDRIS